MWLLPACVLSHLQEQPSCSSLPGSHQPGGQARSLLRASELSPAAHHACGPLWSHTAFTAVHTPSKAPVHSARLASSRQMTQFQSSQDTVLQSLWKVPIYPPWGAAESIWGICYSLGNSVSWVHHGCEISPNFQTWSCIGFPAIYSNTSQTLPLPADRKFPKHEEGKELKGQEKRFPKPLQVSKDSHRSPCPFSNVSRNATDGNTFIYNEAA